MTSFLVSSRQETFVREKGKKIAVFRGGAIVESISVINVLHKKKRPAAWIFMYG